MRRPLLAALVVHAAACGARTHLAVGSGRPEVCNGLDDDGDGAVDEGIPPQRCGVGACAREVPGCVDGRVPACEPGAPSPEVCNGLDDDCDGTADDGLGFGPIAGPYTIWDAPTDIGVWESALVPVSGGMLALYRELSVGATLHARKLDGDGLPAAPDQLLPLANSLNGMWATASPSGGAVIAYCGATGDFLSDRVAMGARLRADGSVEMGDVPVASKGRQCGAMTPGVHPGVA